MLARISASVTKTAQVYSLVGTSHAELHHADLSRGFMSCSSSVGHNMRAFFAQHDYLGVFHYAVDCLSFMDM